ncbi:MAG: helix-hairpin-helix domain-containing protein [Steroidobacteraceae bacterium]
MTHSIRRVACLLAAMLAFGLAMPVMAAVDINKADAATLAKELKGVGAAKAKAIVEYRNKNGAFKSINELLKVTGIGEKLLDQNRSNLTISSGNDTAAAKKTN